MQLFLVAAFIPIVNILWCDAIISECHLNHILPKCEYEQCCVHNSLKTCCNSTKTPIESSLTDDILSQLNNITNTLTVVQTLLQETRSELENVSNFQSEVKTLLQEVQLEQQIENKKSAKFETVINSMLKNCADLRVLMGDEFSGGVQTVHPYGFPNPRQTTVYCDQVSDGGGWIVIQSRSPLPIRENFHRNWTEYVEGFGDLKGEFWLGLDNIHALTNSAQMQLRIDLEAADGEKAWAHYSTFHVGDAAASEYVLSIGGFSGDAEDLMTDPSDKDYNLNGMKFSTQDNDNDLWSSGNCAERFKGGWWFKSCGEASHVNGQIIGSSHYLKKATMRIRPVSLGF